MKQEGKKGDKGVPHFDDEMAGFFIGKAIRQRRLYFFTEESE